MGDMEKSQTADKLHELSIDSVAGGGEGRKSHDQESSEGWGVGDDG